MTDESWFDTAKKELEQKAELDEKAGEAEKWTPEPDTYLEGYLRKVDLVPGKWGDSYAMLVEDLDNKIWKVWASSKVFKDELLNVMPGIGSPVVFTYLGQREGQSGQKYHLYQVAAPTEQADVKLWHKLTTFVGDTRDLEAEIAATEDEFDPF